MSTSLSPERLLPSPRDLELAEYAMGFYLSELDQLATTVARELGTTISLAEYGALRDAGVTNDELQGPDVSDVELLELIAFTADAIRDATSITEQANEIQAQLLGELHDRRNPRGDDWRSYEERIRGWHREQLAEGR